MLCNELLVISFTRVGKYERIFKYSDKNVSRKLKKEKVHQDVEMKV